MADATVATGLHGRWQIVVNLVSQNVAANTSYLRVRGIIYDDGYASYSNNAVTKSITGTSSWSGSGPFSVASYSSTTFIDVYFTVTHGADGNLTVSYTANLGSTGTTNIGGPASVSVGLTLPRIVQPPAAPSSVVATRTSDTVTPLGWTRNATTPAPYDGQSVWAAVNGGVSALAANILGTAASYTYTSAPNKKYVFVVKASNVAGSATSVASNVILTTPNPLASLAAALITSGTIRLTIPVRPTPYTEAQVVITETHNAGVTWNTKTTIAMASLPVSGTMTWNDTAAGTSGTVQYRAVVKTTGGTQGVLSSAVRLSNVLILNTPPNPPTGLAPSGVVDASRPIRLVWTHSASADGAAQSSRKLEYSTNGGGTWVSIVSGNSTLAYYDWTPALGSFTAGQSIIFRAATAGSQPGTYGGWSATQTLTLWGRLAVTLTAGNPPVIHVGGPIPVAWTSSPTWGTATQTQFQVTLTDTVSSQVVYDTGMVSSTDQSASIPSSVQVNDRTYIVTVVLIDNHQIVSLPETRNVPTDYLSPGDVDLVWSYDDMMGQLTFYPTFTDDTSSVYDDTNSWTLERSLDGDTWTPVGAVVGESTITDTTPRVGAPSWYRSVSFTGLGVAGAEVVWEVPAVDVKSLWGWLNYGVGYQSRVRFGWAQGVDVSPGRQSESHEIEGNKFPVAVFGDVLFEKHGINGKLIYGDAMPPALATSTDVDMIAMSQEAGLCVFRDANGLWFTARVLDVKVSPNRKSSGPATAGVSFTIERVAK